ncbi:hypothetical protein [Pontibacter oryzae]|uniref:Uncharacterized protein n=1 Tax=Pontibacter oryzae TaxID=2304593 RepID=A0A399S084_9BACT|nr:hypothetical protein [Pontibacter oryzae]RIJ36621.1 hypothetical protein D1627_12270 [Pontibacter oryzae]
MSTKPDTENINQLATGRMLRSIRTLLTALVAAVCAVLLTTKQVNYTYPMEALLKSIIKDNSIVDDHLYKIKL